MIEMLMEKAWDFLTPNLGGIALVCIGFGVIIGIVRTLVDKLGSTPVLIGIGAIVVAAWAVRYVKTPKIVEVEKEVEKQVIKIVDRPVEKIVERVVKDTSESEDLRQQLAAQQQEKQGILQSLFSARQEIALRDSPEQQKKAAFDRWYKQAQAKPFYEVEQLQQTVFTMTRYEILDGCLVKSVYEGWVYDLGRRGQLRKLTVSVHDKDMKRIGKARTYPRAGEVPITAADYKVDVQELKEDLTEGEVVIDQYGRDAILQVADLKGKYPERFQK